MIRNIFLGGPPIDSLARPAEAEEKIISEQR